MSEDMSPYCSAHDEWLIMKLCMHVGHHDANNVSNFDSDPVTQLNLKTFKTIFILYFAGQTMRPPEIIIDITSEEIRPYLPKHSPSYYKYLNKS